MNALFSALFEFIKPLVRISIPFVTILSLILGAIKNPEGAVNTFLVKMIDLIAPFFPATPPNLKLSYLIDSVDSVMPAVGKAVIFEIFQSIALIISVSIVIKVYKLIPFKAT
ncbi:MAG: hypothetical protein AB4372_06405 [Xenococcus sp. (in: cyanobacteria)]